MSASLVTQAVEAGGRVRDAGSSRAFKHAVNDFVRVLGLVPDEGAGALSSDDGHLLQSIGDHVIETIEERVAGALDRGDRQLLVESVYEIRRLLEEVNRFRHHYAIARHV